MFPVSFAIINLFENLSVILWSLMASKTLDLHRKTISLPIKSVYPQDRYPMRKNCVTRRRIPLLTAKGRFLQTSLGLLWKRDSFIEINIHC